MTAVLIALNIIAGLFLVAVVLLQAGKGADMGAAFGGANPAVFGPTGGQANVLQRVTAVTAVVFMGTSLALAVISARQRSIFDGSSEPPPIAAPLTVPDAGGNVATGEPVAPSADAAAAPEATGDAVPTPDAAAATATPPAADPAAAAPVPADAPPPAAALPDAPAQPSGQ